MKVVIAGGRDFTDDVYMAVSLQQLFGPTPPISHVVCGMARGADLMGLRWAESRAIAVQKFWPQTSRYGIAAFKMRNWDMAYAGDQLVAFWDGISTGTKHMMDAMNSLGKPVWVCMYRPVESLRLDVPPERPSDSLFSLLE